MALNQPCEPGPPASALLRPQDCRECAVWKHAALVRYERQALAAFDGPGECNSMIRAAHVGPAIAAQEPNQLLAGDGGWRASQPGSGRYRDGYPVGMDVVFGIYRDGGGNGSRDAISIELNPVLFE